MTLKEPIPAKVKGAEITPAKPMKTVYYPVRVHTCRIDPSEKIVNFLGKGEKCIEITDGYKGYRSLPVFCTCKLLVTKDEAKMLIETGQAVRIHVKKFRTIKEDENSIWMAQQRQVPRVDLISKADIERAYVDQAQNSVDYIEEVHTMFMENRAKMIVPFKPDPWEGRTLFTFAPDQRTIGSYQRGDFIEDKQFKEVFVPKEGEDDDQN